MHKVNPQNERRRAIGVVTRSPSDFPRISAGVKRARSGIGFRDLQKEFCRAAPRGFRHQRMEQKAPKPLPPRPWPDRDGQDFSLIGLRAA